LTSLEKLELNV